MLVPSSAASKQAVVQPKGSSIAHSIDTSMDTSCQRAWAFRWETDIVVLEDFFVPDDDYIVEWMDTTVSTLQVATLTTSKSTSFRRAFNDGLKYDSSTQLAPAWELLSKFQKARAKTGDSTATLSPASPEAVWASKTCWTCILVGDD